MRKQFETLDIVRQLGVAPSTASIIAALLNGQLHPDRFRSLQQWPLADMGVPVPVTKVMTAVCELLELDPEQSIQTMWVDDSPICFYIDQGIDGQPTIIYDLEARSYLINPIEEVINLTK